MIRKPAVAGKFYPDNPKILQQELAGYMEGGATERIAAKGLMVPHAGYVYSGSVAGQVYASVEIPDRVIILSPNHTGLGASFSILSKGSWQMPMGDVPINESLATKLKQAFPLLQEDPLAHAREHSLEVQLPFLQFQKSNFSFVPMTLSHLSFEECEKLGKAMATVIQSEKSDILIIASSDMNHYEEHHLTLEKDGWALDEMIQMDPKGLYATVHDRKISMCGVIPATVMLVACNQLGASNADVVEHKTSGEIFGDYDAVVGYAGMIIY